MIKQMVSFEWVDACLLGDETTTHQSVLKQGLVHGFVAGIMVCEDKQTITVARDWFDNQNAYRGAAVYPKKLIKKINKYKLAELKEEKNGRKNN